MTILFRCTTSAQSSSLISSCVVTGNGVSRIFYRRQCRFPSRRVSGPLRVVSMSASGAPPPVAQTKMSQLDQALHSLRNGECVAILDDENREAETDLFFPCLTLKPGHLRRLRMEAGGEMYISVGTEVASLFGIPYLGEALARPEAIAASPVLKGLGKGVDGMCQGSCSVALSLDHRSTHTGAPDVERSLTCRRLAELWGEVSTSNPPLSAEEAMRTLGQEFHTPGHIFLCIENRKGLEIRRGHTELSVALARLAGVSPIMVRTPGIAPDGLAENLPLSGRPTVACSWRRKHFCLVGCVMLSNSGENFGALSAAEARKWAVQNNVPLLSGQDILSASQPSTESQNGSSNGIVNGHA